MTERYELSSDGEQRVLIGLAVQPLVGGLLGFCLFPLVEYTGRPLYGGRPADPLDSAVGFAVGVALVAILVTALGAFPLLVWRLTRGTVGRTEVLVSGAALGNLPGALIVAALAAQRLRATGELPGGGDLTYGGLGAVRAIALGCVIGVTCAAVFWLVAGRFIGARPARADP